MLFNSLSYLIFFPTVVILYYLLPFRWRWFLLLIASYVFYGFWKVEYLTLIIISTVIDYYAGIQITKSKTEKRKRLFLYLSLFSNLGLLFTFKYLNFVSTNLAYLAAGLNLTTDPDPIFSNIILPVGISFYTFQTMAYTIDVYRGVTTVEKHFGRFALFVTFFPQLVAGPIERSNNLLPQFYVEHKFSYENVKWGLMLFSWGLFKKVVIADRVSFFVNAVYNNPNDYYGFHIILATFFFTMQIYCDFSAYSDMAIGSAKVMGFNLMKNFNHPQFATSIGDFWRRWHISLSTWLKDYVYFPLGGSRVVKWRMYYNLFLTFFISGIWHGANWTFVIYGCLHGSYIVYETATRKTRDKFYEKIGLKKYPALYTVLMVMITFTVVCFSRIFFRANNIQDAWTILNNMCVINFDQLSWAMFGPNQYNLMIAFAACFFMETVHFVQSRQSIYELIKRQPVFLRWLLYTLFAILIINFGVFTGEDFIYFQF